MPGLYEYTLQINDKGSGVLQKLSGASYEAVQKFVQLDEKSSALKNHLADFGNGISSLKQKIDILQGERDLIDPANMTQIRQYNKEIASLNTQITKLETDTGGSKLGKNLKDAFSQIPGAGLLANPLVMAGAGVAAVGKLGMSWEDGMRKINTTAQMSDSELGKLSSTIKKMGVEAGSDLRGIPTAYESIISQTGDAALTTDIFEKSLKGAKAGFTDITTVSAAAAQSISAIGAKNTNAQELLDTLFAAKRVGAGEFKDFANNIPGLIAAGQGVGVTWKEVAGAFAYMTGKGNSAADSTMLLQNAFSTLGKTEITGSLEKAGVAVFDSQGKMRGLADIMTDLSGVMSTFNPEEKSAFLEAIGLKDQQAKQAFMVLTGETSKLQEAMDATANASGEMQKALDQANTPMNKLKSIFSSIQGIMIDLWGVVQALLNPVLGVLAGLFSGIALVVTAVGDAWNWWTSKLQEGNPWIIGLTTVIGGLAAAIALSTLWAQKDAIWTGIVTAAKVTWAAVTGTLTTAQWGLNTALLANPITWIAVGVMGLVAAFIAAWKHSEKFRAAMTGAWEVVKNFGIILKDFVIDRIKGILSGLGGIASAIGKLFKGDFKGAVQDGKDALADLSGANALKTAIDSGKKLGDKFKEGYGNGLVGFAVDKMEHGFEKDKKTGKWVKKKEEKTLQEKVDAKGPGGEETDLKKTFAALGLDENGNPLDKKKGSKNLNDVAKESKNGVDKELSLGLPQDYNQTGSYAAITQQFGSQVDMAFTPRPPEGGEDPKTKPVIDMATRVNDIAGSLRKIAATAAIPLTLAAGQAAAMQPLGWKPETGIPETGKNISSIIQPTPNLSREGNTLYNAFDQSQAVTNLDQSKNLSSVTNNDLSRKVENISNVANSEENNLLANNSYDNSTLTTNEVHNNSTDGRQSVSTVNNNDQGKNIRIDRFTDKIEIHIHTSDAEAGKETAQNVRDEVEKALAEILNV